MKKIMIAPLLIILLFTNANAKSVGGGLGLNVFDDSAGGDFLLWYSGERHLGWFVSFNTNFKNKDQRDDFYSSIDVSQSEGWGDTLENSAMALSSWSVGALYEISKGLSAYGGIGSGNQTEYFQYCDDTHILGDGGKYWIEGKSESALNLSGGIMYRFPGRSFAIFFTGNTYPQAFAAGVGFLVDW